jgi:hypothetical protein
MNRTLVAIAAVGPLLACGSTDTVLNTAQKACASYCSTIAATCTATGDVQYQGLTGPCDAYCNNANAWPAGTAGANSGNSVACRTTHAGLAANAKAAGDAAGTTLHCGHAGPSGGNVCGTWCENYCFLALRNCAPFLTVAQMGFTDNASCLTACAAFGTGGTINGPGNNVQCRIYHAGAAGAVAQLPHCGHAAVISNTNSFAQPPVVVGAPCGGP